MRQAFLIIVISTSIFSGCVKETKSPGSPTTSAQSSDAGKTPPPSILQWQQTYGSTADDVGNSIAINSTNDAYYVASNTSGNNGNVLGNHGGMDGWVIKIGLDKTLIWQKPIGGSDGDQANAVVGTADGGCVVAGYTTSNDKDVSGNHGGGGDALLVKLTSSGAIEWEKTLGGSGYDRAWAIVKTTDGGFAVAGQTTSIDGDLTGVGGSNSNGKIWLIKFTSAADIEWQKTFVINGSKDDVGYGMTQTADGGFTIVGRTLSISDNADIFVINTTSNGDVNWTKTIGSSGGGGDVAWSVTPSLNNDGCVVTGYMGALNLVAVKLDNSGTIVWQKTYAGSNSGGIQGKAIVPSSQGYVITGFTGSKNGDIVASKGSEDMIVLRLDANGNKISSDVLGGNGSDIGRNLITTPDGAFVAVAQTTSTSGDVSGNHGLNDVWVVKFKF